MPGKPLSIKHDGNKRPVEIWFDGRPANRGANGSRVLFVAASGREMFDTEVSGWERTVLATNRTETMVRSKVNIARIPKRIKVAYYDG